MDFKRACSSAKTGVEAGVAEVQQVDVHVGNKTTLLCCDFNIAVGS